MSAVFIQTTLDKNPMISRLSSYIASKITITGGIGFAGSIVRLAQITVAVSIAIMILGSALVRGFKEEITRKVFSFWGHIHVSSPYTGVGESDHETILLDTAFIETLRNVESLEKGDISNEIGDQLLPTKGGVSNVSPVARFSGIIQGKNEIEGLYFKAVQPDYNPAFVEEFMTQGRFFDESSLLSTEDSVKIRPLIISETVAKRLYLKLDEQVVVYFVHEEKQVARRFQIIGIFNTGLEEYDSRFAIISLTDLQDILAWKPEQITNYEIHVDHLSDMDAYHYWIYYDQIGYDLVAESIRYKFPTIFDWLELQNVNESVIILLMMIVCMVNMATTILILIIERTNMIGLLKSFGMRDKDIIGIFMIQAGKILVKGLVIGNILGFGLGLAQMYFKIIPLDEASYYLSYAPIHFNLPFILLLNIVTIVLTFLFLVVPAMWILRIRPVKAIQFN